MGLVDDDQVPAGRSQVLETVAVVRGHAIAGPAPAPVQGLDRVHRADDLVVGLPDVVFLGDAAERGEVARDEEAELLVEVGAHFRDPLGDESLGRHDQRAAHRATQLELAHDEPCLDRLAQADLVRQQVADAVVRDRTRQGADLVRQGDHRRLDGRQQDVLGQGVGDSGRRRQVGEPRGTARRALSRGLELARPDADSRVPGGNPHAVQRVPPQVLHLDDPADLLVFEAPCPFARLKHRLSSPRGLPPRAVQPRRWSAVPLRRRLADTLARGPTAFGSLPR